MTKAEIRNEIAKLEEIHITCCDNQACSDAIGQAIHEFKVEIYGRKLANQIADRV